MVTDNEKKTLDYGAFLADLEAKRAVLDQAIASVRAVMASGALAVSVSDSMPGIAESVSVALHGGEVPAGAFNGLSIPAAAKLYLSIVKKKQTTKEIADALRQGGMETAGRNFEVIVGSALYRISDSKNPNREVVRVKGAWGLAAWWPAGVRAAQDKENGRRGRKAKRPRKQKSAEAATTAVPHTAAESNGHKTTRERVINLLQGNPSNVYTSRDVSKALNIELGFAGLTLGKLAAKKLAEKVEAGKYRAAHG